MSIEIRFEAHNNFHPDRLPKIIYSTGEWEDFARIIDRFFIAAWYTQYSCTSEVTINAVTINTILKHIDAAIDEYERINVEFIESYCDPEIPHDVVKYKNDTFIATIDEDIYIKLKDMSNTLHAAFDGEYKWDRYTVSAVCYEV